VKFECSSKIKASAMVASMRDLFLYLALRFFYSLLIGYIHRNCTGPPSMLHMVDAE
jgi:hypothetical protein